MGAKVTVCSHLIPYNIKDLGADVTYKIEDLIEWADALNILRIQKERMGLPLIPSVREYRTGFGLTTDRLKHHKKEIIIMHQDL